jgi:hypothetical protein
MRRLALPGYGLVGPATSEATQRQRVIPRRAAAEKQGVPPVPVSAPDRHAAGTGVRQQARVQA